ncbi:MAG: hypothetical protein WC708_06190 [Lentisphaeria bacterium]
MANAVMSFRIGVPQWLSDVRFAELLALLGRYPGVTDEITFFTSETHAPLPLAELRRRAAILKDRMGEVRQAGWRTGINLLATIGHHEENLENSLAGAYTRATDLGGKVSRGSFCPNDPRFRGEYVKPLYEILARAEPDYLWIDDDVRLAGHMPIGHICFCDACLELFHQEYGTAYSRDTLKAAFDTGAGPDKLVVRRAWLQHNRNTVASLLGLIERTVHAVRPRLPLGFMDGSRFYEGFDLDTWAAALAGPDGAEVYWRPGGGCYEERTPDEFINKAHEMGRDAAVLPATVRSIQSEIECFPYERLAKSTQAVAFEAAVYIAGGCTGAAYNVLSMYDEPLTEYEPLVARLAAVRPFLDRLADAVGRTAPTGIFTGWGKDSFSTRNLRRGEWLGDPPAPAPALSHADALFHLGLPVAYQADQAQVFALSSDSVRVLSDQGIRDMLSRGVFLDARALAALNEMGYGELTGFEVVAKHEADMIERLLPHPLNGDYAGRCRDCRQSFLFWKKTAYSLRPRPGAEVLAELVDYRYQTVAACGMGVFENALGGRVCVAGYYPWTRLENQAKATQMKTVFRWLARDTLGAYVPSYHRISLWDRVLADGRHAVALANCYLDPAEQVELMLLTDAAAVRVSDMANRETLIPAASMAGAYRRFILPRLEPWQLYLVVTG